MKTLYTTLADNPELASAAKEAHSASKKLYSTIEKQNEELAKSDLLRVSDVAAKQQLLAMLNESRNDKAVKFCTEMAADIDPEFAGTTSMDAGSPEADEQKNKLIQAVSEAIEQLFSSLGNIGSNKTASTATPS